MFVLQSLALGAGLAMDAFSVSMADGLNEPEMKRKKMLVVAGVFAAFQAAMPLLGWLCVHTLLEHFTAFEKFIPWIALILLLFIGGKMLADGFRGKEEIRPAARLTLGALLLQGIATSIDALSVGFTIAEYNFVMAFASAFIIAAVTFALCSAGLVIGKKFGTALSGNAQIFGGIILILIGLRIFISGIFG